MKLFPAIRGQVGSWNYYATKMSAAALNGDVHFAAEFDQPKVLDAIIQRELKDARAKTDIARYLAENPDRFFNSIVVAAWEGNPTFFPVQLADDPRFAMITDRKFSESFGVLTFDGNQKYYALDGQHRLKAIKALLAGETDFSPPRGFQLEEFPVVIVVPKTEETRVDFFPRYRRLFSNLNRYAKPMELATIIAMDEDDSFAIITRRLIGEHKFFQWFEGDTSSRIRVLGGKAVPESENCFISLVTLYEMNRDLLWSNVRRNDLGKVKEWIKLTRRGDDELNGLFAELVNIWDAILEELPVLSQTPTDFRSSKGEEYERDGRIVTNHLLFRPIGQSMLAILVRKMLDHQPGVPASKTLRGLKGIEWRLYAAPWRHLLSVWDSGSARWKMRTDKDAQQVASNLLAFITGVTVHDEGTLATLEQSWREHLIMPDPEYCEMGWKQVLAMAEAFSESMP